MVAPHNTGDLVRSLVRIPDSGGLNNSSVDTIALNLGRVSTLVASRPVITTTIPPYLTKSKTSKVNSQENQNSVQNKLGGDATEILNEVLKFCQNIGSATASSTTTSHKRSLPDSEESAGLEPVKKKICITQQVADIVSSSPSGYLIRLTIPQYIDYANTTIKVLTEEVNTLRQQVHLFQMLFKNKDRLIDVVKRLGVKCTK
ncbi:hypothetical protein Hamer_G018021 [Homarus americanus]|uniref:Uncharacterized protein n=1 Tax=Homarus americanus TaxID=6706 RepID=A0A8J5N0A7_HOMAM|nr:hypothetical protein Hamer_G018021 [Homarus americanus]